MKIHLLIFPFSAYPRCVKCRTVHVGDQCPPLCTSPDLCTNKPGSSTVWSCEACRFAGSNPRCNDCNMLHHDNIPVCPTPCPSGLICCFVPNGPLSLDMCDYCDKYYDVFYGDCSQNERCAFRTFKDDTTICYPCTRRLQFIWERVLRK